MNDYNHNLAQAFLMSNEKTFSICAENPDGKKGAGGNYTNHLGLARKGRPCINLAKESDTVLADVEGPGIIRHIWFTVNPNQGGEDARFALRNIILKMYWDGEQTPSVEVPLGDFFANGFGQVKTINSLPILSNPTGGFNCYFPLPFRKHAKIVLENTLPTDIGALFYQITYSKVDSLPENTAYFHAWFNRTEHVTRGVDHVIVDNIKGKGHYVGTYLAWGALGRSWWGEGEIKFFMDGDTDFPTINGTGTEDYVGGAWCFYGDTEPACYTTPYLGYVYYKEGARIDSWSGNNIGMHGMYRWHLMDPIHFDSDLKVTIQDIGHNGTNLFERDDDISSVAYWYQTEPHTKFPKMLDNQGRRPR